MDTPDIHSFVELLINMIKPTDPNAFYNEFLNESIETLKNIMSIDAQESVKVLKTDILYYKRTIEELSAKLQTSSKDQQLHIVKEINQKTMDFVSVLKNFSDSLNAEEVSLFPDDVARLRDQILVDLEDVE
ncbi:hypothetical protein EIN_169360 [Entamoeba invadens IP1]|uniref:Uncharacterized protein n=1 Tax=Entamoeba invadens IP1 TaxID=370355 RepID=A0A0A1TVQ7_ENTIV|nr:hypothetical protein EIN_169360 [Entamoeba invadens IP1]ELP84501.1 hypothetical protein EIN_169360 [Entamoeba invadens IP1]|eukprot:XP_004183847.1 hypothetical protein EIN_169360 [Entamoeba invadens IP1]